MKLNLMKTAGNLFGKVKLGAKRHEAEILVGAGLVSGAAALYATVKGTMKSLEAKTAAEEALEKVTAYMEEATASNDETYTDEVYQKDLKIVKRNYCIGVVRAYIPAAAFGIASAALVLSGTGVLKKRNAALATAYSGLASSYEEYRKRVADRYGAETERDIYRGVSTEIEEEAVTDPETGEVKTTVTGTHKAENLASPYARVFAEDTTDRWQRDASYVIWLVNRAETELNELLNARGYVFLNEAYDKLGFERTLAGQEVGWLKDGDGDHEIDFGISKEMIGDYLNARVKKLAIDFNVDGPILNKATCLAKV